VDTALRLAGKKPQYVASFYDKLILFPHTIFSSLQVVINLQAAVLHPNQTSALLLLYVVPF